MLKRGQDWTTTVNSDEKVFVLQPLQRAAWAPKGNRRQRFTRHFPSKLMVWGAISMHGSTKLAFIPGTLDATAYQSVLQTTLVPLGKRLNRLGMGWSFQQDNARPHVAFSTMAWLAAHPILPLPISWPACSPDASPIENLWALVERDVDQSNPTDLTELRKAIEDSWKARTDCATCMTSLMGGWKRRVQQLAANGGSTLKY